jgi:integrase
MTPHQRQNPTRRAADVRGERWPPDQCPVRHARVPLPTQLVEPLARRCEVKQPDDLLVTTPTGSPLHLRKWRRMVWDPAVAAAGLSDVTPHDLRHTAASLAVASGAQPRPSSACSAMPPRP